MIIITSMVIIITTIIIVIIIIIIEIMRGQDINSKDLLYLFPSPYLGLLFPSLPTLFFATDNYDNKDIRK